MASSSPTKNICKFRLENNVFISATEEINASELEEYIVELVQSGILPHGTIFYLMGGIHHGLNSEEEVIPGMTDFKLLQGFYHKIYSCLIELDIWDQKKHDYILILGCPKITPSVKCLAPEAFSGAKLQMFMENGQKNEID